MPPHLYSLPKGRGYIDEKPSPRWGEGWSEGNCSGRATALLKAKLTLCCYRKGKK